MLAGVCIEAGSELLEIAAKRRRLLLMPLLAALNGAYGAEVEVVLQIALAPIFRRAAARLTVQLQQQICVAFHLRVTEGEECSVVIARKYVGNAIAIPRNFYTARCARRADKTSRGEYEK